MSDVPNVLARVTRRFSEPPESTFGAWLDPAQISRWMFANDEVMRIALEPRVGGTFSFVVRRQGREIDHVGTYLEIDRPHRLAFTWGTADSEERSRVIITVEPQATGSAMTVTHEMNPQWAHFVPQAEASWGKMLDALAAALPKQG